MANILLSQRGRKNGAISSKNGNGSMLWLRNGILQTKDELFTMADFKAVSKVQKLDFITDNGIKNQSFGSFFE